MPTQRGGYGYQNYSQGDYGTEGVVQESGALSVSASASVTSQGGRDVPSGALAIASTSSIASFSADRDRLSSATISASVTITASGEGIIYEDTDKYAYGSGLYGQAEYTQGDLQTIVIGQSSTASVGGEKIQLGGASVSASSSTSADSEKVFQGSGTVSASSTNTCTGTFTVNVNPNDIQSQATISVTIARVRLSSGTTASQSAVVTIGREKWETITRDSTTWDVINEASTTWEKLVA